MPRGTIAEQLREAVAGSNLDSPEKEESLTPVEEPEEIQESTEETPEQQAEDQEEYLEYLNDFPEAYDIEPEAFYALKMKLQNGEEIPVGEIKDRLQSISDERKKLEEQRASLEQQSQQAQQAAMSGVQMSQRGITAMAQLNAIQQQLPEFEKQLLELEKEDAGKAALERQKVQQMIANLQGEVQAGQREYANAYQEWMGGQNKLLMDKLPAWKDPKSRESLQRDLSNFAMERYGVTPQQLATIDATTLLILKDAMDGVSTKGKAEDAVNKVRKAPKVMRKGVRFGKQVKKARVAELETKAKGSHRRQDITAAMRGILGEVRNGN